MTEEEEVVVVVESTTVTMTGIVGIKWVFCMIKVVVVVLMSGVDRWQRDGGGCSAW